MKVPMLIDLRSASSFARNGADRHRRATVGAVHDRRDTLPDVVVGRGDLEKALAPSTGGVHVDVDEAGRDRLASDIDDPHGGGRNGRGNCGRSGRR